MTTNTISHPLQSPQWGNFRKAWGNEVIQFPFGQITVHKIPLTNFKIGIFEKGPRPTKEMLSTLKIYAQKNQLIFIKLEPNIIIPEKQKIKNEKLMKELGLIKGKRLFTPTSFWIDLTPAETDLLKSFSPKTRYNIHLAQKKGVKVQEDNSNRTFEKYLELTRETVERQHFFAHTEKYHRLMWKFLGPQEKSENNNQQIAHLLTATYQEEIITTWIVFAYKDFLYYPYGASSEKYKNVMANNLIMWEAIRFGKTLGLKTFDLWGREPGRGFTKFKEGYNPKVIEFLGSWDLVINPLIYWLYRIAENLRWLFLKIPAKLGITKAAF